MTRTDTDRVHDRSRFLDIEDLALRHAYTYTDSEGAECCEIDDQPVPCETALLIEEIRFLRLHGRKVERAMRAVDRDAIRAALPDVAPNVDRLYHLLFGTSIIRQEQTHVALMQAMGVIEAYEAAIRQSPSIIGVDLVALGFCQGEVFTHARDDLYRLAERRD